MGMLVDEKFDTIQQCALTAWNYIPGCMNRKLASRPREATLPLCSTLETSPVVLCPALGSQHKDDLVPSLWSESRGKPQRWPGRELEHLSYGGRLRPGVVQPREKAAPGRIYSSLPVPNGTDKKARQSIWACSDRME